MYVIIGLEVAGDMDIINLGLGFPDDPINPGNVWETRPEIGWDKLDEILAGPFYPSLSQFTVNVDSYFLESRHGLTSEQLKQHLPCLSTSNRIEFNL